MDDLTRISWLNGSAILRPQSMLGGVKFVESDLLPEGKAYVLPEGEMIVPRGMADKISGFTDNSETVDVHGRNGETGTIVTWRDTRLTVDDGTSITLEKIEQMQSYLKEATKRQIDRMLYGEPKADADAVAMEADPMWGAF